ncbi:MAG: transposase family protein [Pyrinomonadaceae bacterium]
MAEYKESNKRGRKSNLSIENQMLLTLSFWREYRTLFHLGRDWQLHESNVSRLVRRVEDILIKSGKFSLPGKKRLLEGDAIKYTIIDATENLTERPKKIKAVLQRQTQAAQLQSTAFD